LPKRQLASTSADNNFFISGFHNNCHQWPHVEQLVAAHPLQPDAPADRLTVSPPFPLAINPQTDICLHTSSLLHAGQSGFSEPKTRHSKSFPQHEQ
jgi:hypothetical protein